MDCDKIRELERRIAALELIISREFASAADDMPLDSEPLDVDGFSAALDSNTSELAEAQYQRDTAGLDVAEIVHKEARNYGQVNIEGLAAKLHTRKLRAAGVNINDLIWEIRRACESFGFERLDDWLYLVDEQQAGYYVDELSKPSELPADCGERWRRAIGAEFWARARKHHGLAYADRYYGQYVNAQPLAERHVETVEERKMRESIKRQLAAPVEVVAYGFE
jgi:hypothetical protein